MKTHHVPKPGNRVLLTEAMSVEGIREAVVVRVDGGDVYVEVKIGGRTVTAHRYPEEMEIVDE